MAFPTGINFTGYFNLDTNLLRLTDSTDYSGNGSGWVAPAPPAPAPAYQQPAPPPPPQAPAPQMAPPPPPQPVITKVANTANIARIKMPE